MTLRRYIAFDLGERYSFAGEIAARHRRDRDEAEARRAKPGDNHDSGDEDRE